jgi:hypothetical protein
MSNGTSTASYIASATLFLKGLVESGTNAWYGMAPESKIGVVLGIGTFVINWYYQRKRDRRAERMEQAGKLVEVQAKEG